MSGGCGNTFGIHRNKDCRGISEVLLGYDYHTGNTYKHGNSNLFRGLDKDSIANQSAISLIIRTTGICWNQVVYERQAGYKELLLKLQTDR